MSASEEYSEALEPLSTRTRTKTCDFSLFVGEKICGRTYPIFWSCSGTFLCLYQSCLFCQLSCLVDTHHLSWRPTSFPCLECSNLTYTRLKVVSSSRQSGIQLVIMYLISSHGVPNFYSNTHLVQCKVWVTCHSISYNVKRQVYTCTCIPTRFTLPSSAEIRVQISMKFLYTGSIHVYYMGYELDLWLFFSLGVLL